MKIAVLTLTRDRLDFTQHCFQRLRENAGTDYDHFVLDQGSEDGTEEWLDDMFDDGEISGVTLLRENVGISKGMNMLLDQVVPEGYDVIVKFDNDCELTVPDTLDAAARVSLRGWIVSPHIMGLQHPPTVDREDWVTLGIGHSYRMGIPNIMGGIFMAAPAVLYDDYRHDESNPIWGLDDAKIVPYWRGLGHEVGYLLDYPANHYLTTDGQIAAEPAYFERKYREAG